MPNILEGLLKTMPFALAAASGSDPLQIMRFQLAEKEQDEQRIREEREEQIRKAQALRQYGTPEMRRSGAGSKLLGTLMGINPAAIREAYSPIQIGELLEQDPSKIIETMMKAGTLEDELFYPHPFGEKPTEREVTGRLSTLLKHPKAKGKEEELVAAKEKALYIPPEIKKKMIDKYAQSLTELGYQPHTSKVMAYEKYGEVPPQSAIIGRDMERAVTKEQILKSKGIDVDFEELVAQEVKAPIPFQKKLLKEYKDFMGVVKTISPETAKLIEADPNTKRKVISKIVFNNAALLDPEITPVQARERVASLTSAQLRLVQAYKKGQMKDALEEAQADFLKEMQETTKTDEEKQVAEAFAKGVEGIFLRTKQDLDKGIIDEEKALESAIREIEDLKKYYEQFTGRTAEEKETRKKAKREPLQDKFNRIWLKQK